MPTDAERKVTTMSTSAAVPSGSITLPRPAAHTARRRFGVPTLADAVFVVVLLRCLQLGATDFFNDPGTGWHLRTGHTILATGTVPHTDPYSFTRAGEPWVQTQWLGDVLMSLAYGSGGYALIALATAALIAGLFRWIYRAQMVSGGWPAIALLTTLIAACAAAGHFLARPLVATSLGVPLCFWWATQYAQGRIGHRRLWLLIPITAVWCNLHPGVLGGIATVGLCGVGLFASAAIGRGGISRSEALRRGALLVGIGAAMGAATLVNPYGLGWHEWVGKVMGMGLARYVQEWMPPIWTNPETIAAGLLLAAMLIGVAVRRGGLSIPEALVVLLWVVQSAQNRRHSPLLGMILAIQLGRVLGDLRVASPRLREIGGRVPLFSAGIRAAESRAGGGLVSIVVVAVLGILLVGGVSVPAIGLGVAGPSPTKYSYGAIAHLRDQPPTGPIFNEIRYGGTLVRDVPGAPVFIDDRFGLYGEEFVEDYLAVARAPETHAEALFDHWGIDTVLIKVTSPLCEWLAARPEWTDTYRDELAAVYRRPLTRSNTRDPR